MGYSNSKKVYRLVFEDPEMHGLEVRARAASLGKLMGLVSLAELVNKPPAELTAEDFAQSDQLFRLFSDCLIDWNLEDDDGTAIPPTYEGLMDQDIDWVNKLVEAWMVNTMGVAAPLASSSIGGGLSAVPQLPMVPLSENRAS